MSCGRSAMWRETRSRRSTSPITWRATSPRPPIRPPFISTVWNCSRSIRITSKVGPSGPDAFRTATPATSRAAGYQPGGRKTAIASDLMAGEFQLIDQTTGQAVLSKPLQTVKTGLGAFQVMDFSEVQQPGLYRIDAGGESTRPFRIATDVWRDTILKALNFFYVERCGMAIPGVHGVCHRDWQAVHGDKRIIINGGWHDAGDLTQGMGNTGDIVYAMFSLAEGLSAQGADPQLYDRLIEEARWGLDWVLKTSFGDGYRNAGSVNSRRTDGILGTFDDVTATAKNDPFVNFLASAAEAIAARVLKDSDPRLAAYSLRMAEADWEFAVEGMAKAGPPSPERFHVAFDSNGVVHEIASEGVLASVQLWRATGNQRYADKAVELARVILDSQERKRPAWTTPMLGFFYTSPAKDRILHYVHRGRENAPILALTQLCDALPNHPDWMKWYFAVTLHSEYLKRMAKNTEPYGVLPASIYKDDEYKDAPETRQESFRKQGLNGVPLGYGYYLRLLAVWMDYRGEFGTILPQTEALGLASHLRGDLESEQLAQEQLEWVIGRNPFSQSMTTSLTQTTHPESVTVHSMCPEILASKRPRPASSPSASFRSTAALRMDSSRISITTHLTTGRLLPAQ